MLDVDRIEQTVTHDTWCATYLDEAPEEGCDCAKRLILQLLARIRELERK